MAQICIKRNFCFKTMMPYWFILSLKTLNIFLDSYRRIKILKTNFYPTQTQILENFLHTPNLECALLNFIWRDSHAPFPWISSKSSYITLAQKCNRKTNYDSSLLLPLDSSNWFVPILHLKNYSHLATQVSLNDL